MRRTFTLLAYTALPGIIATAGFAGYVAITAIPADYDRNSSHGERGLGTGELRRHARLSHRRANECPFVTYNGGVGGLGSGLYFERVRGFDLHYPRWVRRSP